MEYNIEFWDNDKYSTLRGIEIKMPVIPKKDDYVNLKFTSDSNSYTGVWRVETVFLNQSGEKTQAEVHVTQDD